jgi:Helix-turn-helix domain
MAEPLSMDLRRRVLAAIAAGVSGRSAGRRFGVSAPSVSRWRALERRQGDAAPRPVGGDHRSHRTEAVAISSVPLTADGPQPRFVPGFQPTGDLFGRPSLGEPVPHQQT